MSQQNAELARKWFEEVWNQRKESAIDELLAPDGVAHGLGPEPIRGPEEFKAFHRMMLAAFPDARLTLNDVLCDGDKTVVRFSCVATHGGAFGGVEATQKPVAFGGIIIARWKDGQIVEGWNSLDQMGLMQQIGSAAV